MEMSNFIINPVTAFAMVIGLMTWQCPAATPDEVADQVDIAIKELHERMSFRNPTEVPPVGSKYLGAYSDAELVQGINAWMSRAQGKDLALVPSQAGNLIQNDTALMKDSTELRKLIAAEGDPLRFFLLCRFAGDLPREETFIPEMSHMLFRHGRVDPPHVRFYEEGVGDVSKFTYDEILGILEFLNAPFDQVTLRLRGESLDSDIKVLVKWLRANWPGCEHVGDGEALMAESGTDSQKSKTPAGRLEKRVPTGVSDEAQAQSPVRFLWPSLAVGIIVMAARFVWRLLNQKLGRRDPINPPDRGHDWPY